MQSRPGGPDAIYTAALSGLALPTGMHALLLSVWSNMSLHLFSACPASVQEEMCDETNRICYDDYFGCRYCHCALDIKRKCSISLQDYFALLFKTSLHVI